jgi:chemotaxis protein MotB
MVHPLQNGPKRAMKAATQTNQAPIVIKKIKKGGGHGHHGGAWKVAYADFVTAMMAFFLLMWLINTTSPDQKRGIADFFAPASVSQTTSGSGGMLAGTAIAEEGVKHGEGAPLNMRSQSEDTDPEDTKAAEEKTSEPSAEALAKARALREDSEFEKAEMAIRQALQDMPDVAELSKHVVTEITPEGLRIQIVDQEGRSMFAPGEAKPNERAQRLIAAVAGVAARLPNRLSIGGHTDGGAPAKPGYTNWELSADRANAARRVLQSSGITADRIYQVAGKADSEPLFPDDPTLPGNRRISITLLREAPTLPPGHGL